MTGAAAARLPIDPMDFIDLKTQYRDLRDSVNARIQKVLDHGQYILGPEVVELEQKLAKGSAVSESPAKR